MADTSGEGVIEQDTLTRRLQKEDILRNESYAVDIPYNYSQCNPPPNDNRKYLPSL